MKAWLWLFVSVGLFASTSWSQADDDPLPYDDAPRRAPKEDDDGPRKRRKGDERLREEEDDATASEETLGHTDDPNIGLSFEVLAGLMLLEASRAGLDPRFMVGGRVTWEFGRLLTDEFWREAFFADLTYSWSATNDGTRFTSVNTSQHYVTLAPAIAYPFKNLPLQFFGQLGLGLNATAQTIRTGETVTPLSGTKFLFQYGVGLRARPALTENEKIRLSFRFELTRFIRGYMHDMFIGGSVGLTF
jgi:hypothetical protein